MYYKPLVKTINDMDKNYWDIDVDNYETNKESIFDLYKEIKSAIVLEGKREKVLITKIMLGVFGITPAFDEYFCAGFKKIDPQKSKFSCFWS